jgi:hypothetical protein
MKRHINPWVAGFSIFCAVAAFGAGCGSDKQGGSGRGDLGGDPTGGSDASAGNSAGARGPSGGDGGSPSPTVAGGVGGASGIGGAGAPAVGGAADCGGPPPCIATDGFFCEPEGFPFVGVAFPIALTCAGAMCQPPNPTLTLSEPGKLCLSSAAPPGGFVAFHADFGGVGVALPVDADALGIAQISFTLGSPPPEGVKFDVSTRKPCNCSQFLPDCLAPGFDAQVTTAGKHVFAFADYPQLNTHALAGFGFTFSPDAPYDVCVSDFEFLDAEGNVVTP